MGGGLVVWALSIFVMDFCNFAKPQKAVREAKEKCIQNSVMASIGQQHRTSRDETGDEWDEDASMDVWSYDER